MNDDGDTSSNFITDRQLALLKSTTEIVTAIVGKPGNFDHMKVIDEVYTKVSSLIDGASTAAAPVAESVERPTPAQVRKSITPDALISFIDGGSYKTLKRHLGTHGLDPRTYRERYGLPNDYPMVAHNYAAQRSALAKSIGLGQPGGQAKRKAA